MSQEAFAQIFPRPGWVEHDPEAIWRSQMATARQAMAASDGRPVAAIGVANQRETVIVWDRRTGLPIHNAIVWQDRRTAETTQSLRAAGLGELIAERTGLVVDPYFSATKIAWILDAVPGARERARRGELAAGTIDTFLIWRLTEGRSHVTDATNASRTSLYDIVRGCWDDDLCEIFAVPRALLPEVCDSAGMMGVCDLFGPSIPIAGAAGDQQAALIGQACFQPGDVKSTYGTGAFLVLNTGRLLRRSASGLLGTIAYQIGGHPTYALEGSILSAGSTIQWLRDGLGLIADGAEAGRLAAGLEDTGGVYLVPAFAGLGAPYWDPDARGAIVGLTRGAQRAHVARAGLEATAYQTAELLEAMARDGVMPARLKVDGAMARNDWLMGFMADLTGVEVVRPANTETTALGAAMLALFGAGLAASLEETGALWSAERRFAPSGEDDARRAMMAGWRGAVARVLSGGAS
jgi:glycerol kinase